MTWRKSSFTETNNCVELRIRPEPAIRDSKQPDGPVLAAPALRALVRELKADRLGRL